jgi:hypothetical protein
MTEDRIYFEEDDGQPETSSSIDEKEWLPKLYDRASKYNPDLTGRRAVETFRATGRILAWLDLARSNQKAKFGYEASGFLEQRISRLGLKKERPKSSKPAASYVDIDVIESFLDGAFGKDHCSADVRAFVCNVLGVLGLVRFTEDGEAIPTRVLGKLVSVCRQQERYQRKVRQEKKGTTVDEENVEQWRAVRKDAGPRIDPDVAEVASQFAYTVDPYGVCSDLPEEARTVGREWYARCPGSDVWVLFDDLPYATQKALTEPCGGQSKNGRGKGQVNKKLDSET